MRLEALTGPAPVLHGPASITVGPVLAGSAPVLGGPASVTIGRVLPLPRTRSPPTLLPGLALAVLSIMIVATTTEASIQLAQKGILTLIGARQQCSHRGGVGIDDRS